MSKNVRVSSKKALLPLPEKPAASPSTSGTRRKSTWLTLDHDSAARRRSKSMSQISSKPSSILGHHHHDRDRSPDGSGGGGGQTIVNPRSRYYSADVVNFTKKYGLINAIKILTVACIGLGLFTTPGRIFSEVRNEGTTLLVWGLCGAGALLGSVVYVEMGVTFPASGGDYAYLNEVFGSSIGFLYQWGANFIFGPCTNAILAYVTAQNLLAPFISKDQYVGVTMLVAIAVIMFLSYLVSVRPTFPDEVRNMTFFTTVFILLTILLGGVVHIARFGALTHTHFRIRINDVRYPKPTQKLGSVSNVLKGIYLAVFSFLPLNTLNLMTEEVRVPSKTLPFAVLVSIPVVLVTYLGVTFLYFAVLDEQIVLDSASLPNALIQQSFLTPGFYPYTDVVILPLVAFVVGVTMAERMTTFARLMLIGTRMGHVPKMCGLLSVTSSFPVVAVTLMALLSCCYVVLIGFVDLETWMIFATNVNLPFVALSAFSLIYMRINKPEIQRPLKLPLIVPTIFAGMCTILFITPIFTLLLDVTNGIKDNKRVQKYVGFLAGPALLGLTGIPIYRILIRGDKSHRCIRLVHDKLTLLAQKVFVALPEGALMKNKRHSR